MTKIMLAVPSETSFRELFRVALLLKRSGEYEPCVYFHVGGYSLGRMRAACSDAGISYFPAIAAVAEPRDIPAPELNNKNRTIFQSIKNTIVKVFPSFMFEIMVFVKFLVDHAKLSQKNRKAFSVISPAMVVVPEDGVGGNLHLIKMAHKRGLPVITIPYEYSTKKQIVEAVKNTSTHQNPFNTNSLINRTIAHLFPKWVFEFDGERMLRERPLIILALEILHLAPRDPWTVHGGYADFIAVESPKMFSHYIREGIPEKKLVLTGSMADDHLLATFRQRDALRADLCSSLGLKGGRNIILSSIPTDYTSRPECEFKNYEELIDFWIESLNHLKDVDVVLQLHPAVSPEQERYIRSKHFPISDRNIANLIPLCDVFVTSVSSVIRMAIVCQVPVLNYDVYQFGYKDYEEATGVMTVSSQFVFSDILNRLTSDQEFRSSITARHSSYSSDWGFFDGKSGERILKLFDDVLSNKLRRSTS